MNEHRKNPFRRPPSTGEQRPGLRQLPKDFDDLANGRTERLPRPRRAPAPLHDEREGAVIPGVRNTEARAVYDARVRVLRHQLAEGRLPEVQAGLEAARQLRLWRARNVTDFRAFVESVIGLSPEQADQLSANDQPDAPRLPDHVVALAVRLEAALLPHAKSATVTLRAEDSGQLRLSVEMPVADVHRAVDALEDAGRAVSGLRYFLREGERPRDYPARGDRDAGAAAGGERRPPRERRDDFRSGRVDAGSGARRFERPERDDVRPRVDDSEGADAQSELALDASGVIESAVASAASNAVATGAAEGFAAHNQLSDSPAEDETSGDFDDTDEPDVDASVDGEESADDDESGVDLESGALGDSDNDESDDDYSDDEAEGDEPDDDVADADADDQAAVGAEPGSAGRDDVEEGAVLDAAADEGLDAGSRRLTRGRARDASQESGDIEAGSRPLGRGRDQSGFGAGGMDDRGVESAGQAPERERSSSDERNPADSGRGPRKFGRDQGTFDRRGSNERDAGSRGFGRGPDRGAFDKRGADSRDAGSRGFGRGPDRGAFDKRGADNRDAGPRGFGRGPDRGAFDKRGPNERDAGPRGFGRGPDRGAFDKRGPNERDAGPRGFGRGPDRGAFDKRGADDRDAGPRRFGQDTGPKRFARDRDQSGFDQRDAGPRRFGPGRDQGAIGDRNTGARGFGGGREQGAFDKRGRDDRDAGPRFGRKSEQLERGAKQRGTGDRETAPRFGNGPNQGFDKRGAGDRDAGARGFGTARGRFAGRNDGERGGFSGAKKFGKPKSGAKGRGKKRY